MASPSSSRGPCWLSRCLSHFLFNINTNIYNKNGKKSRDRSRSTMLMCLPFCAFLILFPIIHVLFIMEQNGSRWKAIKHELTFRPVAVKNHHHLAPQPQPLNDSFVLRPFFNGWELAKSASIDKRPNCSRVLANDREYISELAKQRIRFSDPEKLDMDCRKGIRRRNYFPEKGQMREDADFPLAQGRMVYKNYVLVEKELASAYSPHNWYCYVIDTKADMNAKWSNDGRLDPNGMEWNFKAQQLFKKKTKNSLNSINGFPAKLVFAKGYSEFSLSRKMADFLLHDLDLRVVMERFDKVWYGGDEILLQTLNDADAIRAPGGFTRKCWQKGYQYGMEKELTEQYNVTVEFGVTESAYWVRFQKLVTNLAKSNLSEEQYSARYKKAVEQFECTVPKNAEKGKMN